MIRDRIDFIRLMQSSMSVEDFVINAFEQIMQLYNMTAQFNIANIVLTQNDTAISFNVTLSDKDETKMLADFLGSNTTCTNIYDKKIETRLVGVDDDTNLTIEMIERP